MSPAGSIELVQAADGLGFHRFWIGEHHSQHQCANPLLLATVLAGLTRRIRVGTGGVCLAYANPYRVAEDARLAAYLFPDRLDLGVARGLAYPPALLAALGGESGGSRDAFAERVAALHQYVTGRLPPGHPLADTPLHLDAGPPVWVLGTSRTSGLMAAALGVGFCLSLHHSPDVAAAGAAIAAYTGAFSPSPEFPEPAAIAVVSGVCAETPAAAAAQAARISGEAGGSNEAGAGAAHPSFVGGPAECAEQLSGLARRLAIDELMVLDFIAEQWAERLRMYELLAGELGLERDAD